MCKAVVFICIDLVRLRFNTDYNFFVPGLSFMILYRLYCKLYNIYLFIIERIVVYTYILHCFVSKIVVKKVLYFCIHCFNASSFECNNFNKLQFAPDVSDGLHLQVIGYGLQSYEDVSRLCYTAHAPLLYRVQSTENYHTIYENDFRIPSIGCDSKTCETINV